MITLIVLIGILGLGLIILSGVGVLLLDPIIAILSICGLYKLVRLCFGKRKK